MEKKQIKHKISKLNPNNLKYLEKYKKHLKYTRAVTLHSDSIQYKLTSIRKYEEITKYADFKTFDLDKAILFHKSLAESDLEYSTMFKHLFNVQEFLHWLFTTHRLPKKFLDDALAALEPTEEEKRLSYRLEYIPFPSIDEFDKLMAFEELTLEDKRDKAIIAFLFISQARISATATATMESIDIKEMLFKQDPLENIKTKRNKHIISKLLKFDKKYYDLFLDWYSVLQDNGFCDKDPLFPAIKDEKLIKKPFGKEQEYNKMLEKRCKQVGIPIYNPHGFRHFGISEAMNRAGTGRQIKALSQSVGHESIATILQQYANMPVKTYTDILTKVFETAPADKKLSEATNQELVAELQRRMNIENGF